ncbi:HD-GYP domain-containing protein [Paenibacillus sp. GCM10023252]|uniref:HD-GYP domain-containing protein n=1 Tax=Paenibacillus sp. GCM10023252 TaxID=3252649 RepID=UPI003621BDF7
MTSVAIAQVKLGDKIGEDVLTPLGSVLLQKGKVVTPRELEILQAFIISSIVVDRPAGTKLNEEPAGASSQSAATAQGKAASSGLHDEYEKMIILLRRVWGGSVSGQGMPMMDIRTQLESLLQHVRSYNVLTFMPRHFDGQDYVYHNSITSALTSYLMAQWNNLPQREWMQVALAGLFHDIGNMKIDQDILAKPAALTASEKEEMQRHTLMGYQLLKNIVALNEGVKLAALQHHEKVDGSGYPLGIDATKIHPYAKIVAIADIFHAMTLNKTYRKAASPYLVLEQIQSDAFGKLDPGYVRTFIERVTQFHNGTVVRLSDERVGEIVFTDQNHPTRPWVSINGSIVNLTQNRSLHITEVVQT